MNSPAPSGGDLRPGSPSARVSWPGALETIVADNGKGERRKAALEAIGQRVTTLNGRFSFEQGSDGGPPFAWRYRPYATPAPGDEPGRPRTRP